MQRGVVPREIHGSHQLFQSRDGRLREVGTMRSVARIAKVDPTAERSGLPRGASPSLILPRAGRAVVERSDRRRSIGDQDGELGRGHEEGVVVLDEPTAPTADRADRGQAGDVGIQAPINLLKFVPKIFGVEAHD